MLESWGGERRDTDIELIRVTGAGEESVNCDYLATSAASIPRGFIDVCLVTCDIVTLCPDGVITIMSPGLGLANGEDVGQAEQREDVVQGGQRGLHLLEQSRLLLVD